MSAVVWKNGLVLLKADLKQFYAATVLLALLWLALAPVLFGIANLDAAGAGYVLERYAALIGILLSPRALLPEQEYAVREVVEARAFSRTAVFLGRSLLSAALTFLLLGGFVLVLHLCGGEFSLWEHLLGSFATALLLGALCVFALAATGNVVAGYFPPLVFYLLCLFLGPWRMGSLYLFGLSAGHAGGKDRLVCASLALLALALLWKETVRKIR